MTKDVLHVTANGSKMTKSDNRLLNGEEAKLIHLLSTGKSVTEAAGVLGIADKTARRWLERPHVREAYQEVTKSVASLVRKQIEGLQEMAIEALKESLASPSHLAKIQAIKIVLDRIDPETLKVAQTVTEAPAGPVPAELLPYVNEEELGLIEGIMERARVRKAEADEKVTPMRKTG